MVSNRLSASILNADFLNLNHEIESIIDLVDELHLDICDGSFVPSISFGSSIAKQIRSAFPKKHIDTHLMVSAPKEQIPEFIDAGCNSLLFHLEASLHPLTLLTAIHANAITAGVAIVPKTPAQAIEPIKEYCSRILIMTVNPGFGGQKMINEMHRKIEAVRSIVGDSTDIIIDGGVNEQTIRDAKNAGGNVFVIGSALLQSNDKTDLIAKLHLAIT